MPTLIITIHNNNNIYYYCYYIINKIKEITTNATDRILMSDIAVLYRNNAKGISLITIYIIHNDNFIIIIITIIININRRIIS